jgi:Major Facilitator Superfamily
VTLGTAAAATVEARGWTAGWTVVAALFVIVTVNAGFTFYGLSAYITALTEHGRFTLTQATLGPTISFGVAGLTGIFVARLLKVVDTRLIICSGVLLTASMVALMGHVQTPWQLWTLFGVFGLGSAGFSMLPASTLVLRWFGDAPARAIAITSTGFGVGGTVIPPFLAVGMARYGLAAMGLAVAAVMIVTVFLATILFVRSPSRTAIGTSRAQAGPRGAREEGVLPSQRTRAFVLIGVAYGLLFMSQVAVVTHMLTIGRDRHLDAPIALSALALSNLVFRIACIPFLARAGVRIFTLTFVVIQVAALIVLATASTMAALIVGAILFGATVGNVTVSQPLSVHRAFGVARYPDAFARLFLFTTVGTTAAPALVGALYTAFHGYLWPLLMLSCASTLGGILLFAVPSPAPSVRST